MSMQTSRSIEIPQSNFPRLRWDLSLLSIFQISPLTPEQKDIDEELLKSVGLVLSLRTRFNFFPHSSLTSPVFLPLPLYAVEEFPALSSICQNDTKAPGCASKEAS